MAVELSEWDVTEDPVSVIRDEVSDILAEARGLSGLLGSLAESGQRCIPNEEVYFTLSELADRIAERAGRAGEQVRRLSLTWQGNDGSKGITPAE